MVFFELLEGLFMLLEGASHLFGGGPTKRKKRKRGRR